MEALGARPATTEALTPAVSHSTNCLNCGTALYGVFCSACGQRDIPPYPSVRELVIDAFWELSGWDGRFASTVRALVRRPGFLTREFLEGRRARYLSPLRLYLMSSLVYFLLAATAPEVMIDGSRSLFIGVKVTQTPSNPSRVSRPERVANEASGAFTSQRPLPDSLKKKALEDIARAPRVMQPFLRRAVEDPAGFKRGLIEAMPRMLFALLPVFALIVALFYRGKKFPEHFYFAFHFHAFVFLCLTIAVALRFTRIAPLAIAAGVIAYIWIAVYATLAFRRVYGGSMLATLTKEAGIAVLYGLVSFAAFIVTIYAVSLQR
jgi:Protein of unknown function (DUF3667)